MAPSNQPIMRRLPDQNQRVPITPLLVFDDDEFENRFDVSRIRKRACTSWSILAIGIWICLHERSS